MLQQLWKTPGFLKRLIHRVTIWPRNSTLGYLPKRNKNTCHTKSCTWVCIAALFIIAKSENNPKNPSAGKWINKLWSLYKREYCSAIKRNEVLTYAATWMNLEHMLSEISQLQEDKYFMIPFTWTVQNRSIHRDGK